MKYCHGIIEIWTKNHLGSDSKCNIMNLQHPNYFTKIKTNINMFTCSEGGLKFVLSKIAN